MEKKWTDIWEKTFCRDRLGKVKGKGDVTLFIPNPNQLDTLWMNTFLEDMVDVLNGEILVERYEDLTLDKDNLYWNGYYIGTFRSEGYLQEKLGLTWKEAERLTLEMAEEVTGKMGKSRIF